MRSQLTRRIAMPILFAALLALSGCEVPNDAPKGDDPTKPKTVAELLVGKWRLVKTNTTLHPKSEATLDFGSEGNVIVWKFDTKHGSQTETGIYRVEGNSIYVTMTPHSTERHSSIAEITEERAIIKSHHPEEIASIVLERIR